MNYAYFRSLNSLYPLAVQENSVDSFVLKNGLKIDKREIEISSFQNSLEERSEFREFIHSLKDRDNLFIYDLSILSDKVDEIVKVLNCIFKREIDIFISRFNIKINNSTKSKIVISLLNEVREDLKNIQKRKMGRPKGSLSKSKYDRYRENIIKLLKEGRSVNEISKMLNINRSSLRDYIASRNLKELASIEKRNSESLTIILPEKECKIY